MRKSKNPDYLSFEDPEFDSYGENDCPLDEESEDVIKENNFSDELSEAGGNSEDSDAADGDEKRELSSVEKKTASNDEIAYKEYLKAINQYPLITHEEEHELAKKIAAGSKVARDKLIEANLRLVVHTVKMYNSKFLSKMDIINEGNLGLIEAAETYSPDLDVAFSTYATWRIRRYCSRAVNDYSVPYQQKGNRSKMRSIVQKEWSRLNEENLEPPTISQIAQNLQMSERDVFELMREGKPLVSLDSEMQLADGTPLSDILPDEDTDIPEIAFDKEELRTKIENCLCRLERREEFALKMKYGFLDGREHNNSEIAEAMNFSRERVRQIVDTALAKLFCQEDLRDFNN